MVGGARIPPSLIVYTFVNFPDFAFVVAPALPDEQMVCIECRKMFAESFLFSKFSFSVCDQCRYLYLIYFYSYVGSIV